MAEHSETPLQHKPETDDSQHSFDAFFFIALLVRHKWFILITACISAVAAAIIVFRMPNVYSSSVSVVPPKKAGAGMDGILGSVASTLKDIGFTRVSGNKSGGYDFIVILFSRTLKDSVIKKFNLTQIYDIPPGLSADSALYYTRQIFEENLQVDYQPEGNYVITVSDTDPKRSADMANYMVEIANQVAQQLDRDENKILLKQFDDKIQATEARMALVSDSLARYSHASLVYSPLDQAKAAASALAESKAQMMQQDVGLQMLQQQFGADDPRTKMQEQLVSELHSKVGAMEQQPGFIGNFSLKDAPAAAYQYLRFYTELETMMKLKAMLVPSYEQTKLDQTKYAPALYVLDSAIPPLKKIRPRRTTMMIGAFFAGLLAAAFLVLGRHQYLGFRTRYKAFFPTVTTK